MSLQNLQRIRKLDEHRPSRQEIERILTAIEKNLPDSALATLSHESRFDIAYKAIMRCAFAAMLAAGFRPAAREPGHHAILIQSLPHTLGISSELLVILDALRRKRNSNTYTGEAVDAKTAKESAKHAARLLRMLKDHLKTQHQQPTRA